MVRRKVVQIDEEKCTGCGLCIPNCAEGALQIIDGKARLITDKLCDGLGACIGHCPEDAIRIIEREAEEFDERGLSHWPVQLKLVPIHAPFFKNADLLVVADCVPFAYAQFHEDFLKGRAVVVGCPKLDDIELYREKLTTILKTNSIKSITVLFMEVPCCFGLVKAVENAIVTSGKEIPLKKLKIGIRGEIKPESEPASMEHPRAFAPSY